MSRATISEAAKAVVGRNTEERGNFDVCCRHACPDRQNHRPLGSRQSSVAHAADRRVDSAGRSISEEIKRSNYATHTTL